MSYGIKVAQERVSVVFLGLFFLDVFFFIFAFPAVAVVVPLLSQPNGRTSDPGAPLLPPAECEWLRVVLQPHRCQVGTHSATALCARVCVWACLNIPTSSGCRWCETDVHRRPKSEGGEWKGQSSFCPNDIGSLGRGGEDGAQMGASYPVVF